MYQPKGSISVSDFNKGLYTGANILSNEKGQSPNCMNVKWNFDGSIQKRLGSTTQNSVRLGSTSLAGWLLDGSGGLSASLQAYWKLNETSSTRQDERGTNHLSDNNSVTSETGIRGLASKYVASNSESLIIATTSPLESAANFTIGTWFYLDSTSTTVERTLVSKRDPDVDVATVLLLHCDGADASTTFTDSSASAKTVTAQGNAQLDTAQFKFGTASGLFDGTGDYLTLADSTDWDFGTSDFTIDFWVRFNSVSSNMGLFDIGLFSSGFGVQMNVGTTSQLDVRINTTTVISANVTTLVNNQWYHIALTRKDSTLRLFLDGSQVGTVANSSDITGGTSAEIAASTTVTGIAGPLNGWVDEFRITKGVARWTSNFTVPAFAYSVRDYEYWLYVNTDNIVTFRVSSSGLAENATVRATSYGAVAITSWYRVMAWHSDSTHIGIDVNLSVNTALYTSNVRIGSAPFVIGALSDSLASRPVKFMDGRIDETSYWKKTLTSGERADIYGGGTGNTYTAGQSGFIWGMYDFGASSIRWLTVAAGTGIYASSNLAVTFVTVGTTRTQNYQYFERSRNVLIATSDSYDVPMYWAGSAGTFFATLAPNSAPSTKFSINYQGFLILLNSSARKRGFFYNDDNAQLTSAWANSFDLPSTADDEITAAFVVNKILYVSTRYKIFRVSYVGGNPDWSYVQVKDFGYVPRTVKKCTVKGGESVIGLDWNKRVRLFDGSDDLVVSDNIESDNEICEFSTSKVSYAGSGLTVSTAEFDSIEQEYRLCLAIGLNSTQTTHAILMNVRTLAMYPYSNQMFQAMVMAESANRLYLMAGDRSGHVHILNTGNLDVGVTPISDVYESPFLFKQTPGSVQKSGKIDFFFKKTSSGTLYFQDRADFSSLFSSSPKAFVLTKADSSNHIVHSVDIPSTHNVYQYRLTSSSGTADPWNLTHVDYYLKDMGIGKGN